MVVALFLSLVAITPAQTTPKGWRIVKDAKGFCEIAVPADWRPLYEKAGAALLHDATNAIAVIASQPGQPFKTALGDSAEVAGPRQGQAFREYGKADLLSGQDLSETGRSERLQRQCAGQEGHVQCSRCGTAQLSRGGCEEDRAESQAGPAVGRGTPDAGDVVNAPPRGWRVHHSYALLCRDCYCASMRPARA